MPTPSMAPGFCTATPWLVPWRSANQRISSWSIRTYCNWRLPGTRMTSRGHTSSRLGSRAKKSTSDRHADSCVITTGVPAMPSLPRAIVLLVSLLLTALSAESGASAVAAADSVYRNGVIFTADAGNSLAQALAIRAGRIIYVGSNRGLAPYIGATTATVDLNGRFLMPGLIDGHMHPLDAGSQLL